jgi:hypothetical protein
MGPIEAELREAAPDRYHLLYRTSCGAYELAHGAAVALGFTEPPGFPLWAAESAHALPDVLSEAIEAAEALGL